MNGFESMITSVKNSGCYICWHLFHEIRFMTSAYVDLHLDKTAFGKTGANCDGSDRAVVPFFGCRGKISQTKE